MNFDLLTASGIISLAIGFSALVLSFLQSRQLGKQYTKIETHSASLLSISDSLSTRYLGPFPEYLQAVVRIIDTAQNDLRIVNGNPTPAYFSAPAIWLNYSQALERKIHARILSRVVCMNERQRRNRLTQQFPSTNEDWDRWVTEHESKLLKFLQFGHKDITIDSLDPFKFIDLLARIQRRILDESFRTKGINVIEIDQVVPVQVWIADQKEAVFSIQTLPTNAASHGFHTSDPRIVSALYLMTELFATRQEEAVVYPHSRIDTIVVTRDLEKSITFYRDIVGLDMRLLSNPVAIFKYDYASIYVYQDQFFEEQFKLKSTDVLASGMLSIQISTTEYFVEMKRRLISAADFCAVLRESDKSISVKDLNGLVTEFWVSERGAAAYMA